MFQRFLMIALSMLFVAACTSNSSSSSGGAQTPGPNGGQNGGLNPQGGTRTTDWNCVVQIEGGVTACATYTSDAADQDLQQHCQGIPGQVAAQCPVQNFQVNCLIKVDGADIMFRLAGDAAKREEMVQLCQQNGGQAQ